MGAAGFLKAAVPAAYGGLSDKLDVRTLCLTREILAAHDGLADFAFAMQGLGTGSISIAGSEAMKRRILPDVAAGKRIAAPVLSIWGDAGFPTGGPTPVDVWRNWADDVSGGPIDSGHFLPEENPEATTTALLEFFRGGS